MRTTVGEFIINRLKELGIKHIIGVPGDFNLSFIEQINEAENIEFVGACNELNAAYAVDGYGRQSGVGALLTTYEIGRASCRDRVELSVCAVVFGEARLRVTSWCICGF